ncbi:hypothetical protein C4566_01400 [Candidatus Parcubacteria bacterium]|nr:MAG: hypothetical protein C4566_01400 [Candidatus Parcubacteria bacterium]
MANFNKYLKEGEALILNAGLKKSVFKFYLFLLLLLSLFFLMFPAWRAGEAGIVLWFFLVILMLFALVRQILAVNDCYLLTNNRLIYLQAINKVNFKLAGSLYLSSIDKIDKIGRNSICLHIQKKKLYLQNLKDRELLFSQIETYLNSRNLL